MKTLSAKYKGNRLVELSEDIDLPENIEVLVILPEQDEEVLRGQHAQLTPDEFLRILREWTPSSYSSHFSFAKREKPNFNA